jgi:hypothetical protein
LIGGVSKGRYVNCRRIFTGFRSSFMRRCVAALLLLLAWSVGARAEDRSSQRAVLAGVKAFTVETEFAAGGSFAQALDIAYLKGQAEAQLAQAGLPLADRAADQNAPFLSLKFEGRCSVTFGCYGRLDLHMNWLPAVSESLFDARVRSVWLDTSTVYSYPAGLTKDTEGVLRGLLIAFIADYRAANP